MQPDVLAVDAGLGANLLVACAACPCRPPAPSSWRGTGCRGRERRITCSVCCGGGLAHGSHQLVGDEVLAVAEGVGAGAVFFRQASAMLGVSSRTTTWPSAGRFSPGAARVVRVSAPGEACEEEADEEDEQAPQQEQDELFEDLAARIRFRAP